MEECKGGVAVGRLAGDTRIQGGESRTLGGCLISPSVRIIGLPAWQAWYTDNDNIPRSLNASVSEFDGGVAKQKARELNP